MNADGVADLDRHQVFTKLNGTRVVLSYESNCGSRHDGGVRKHCELWLHSLQHSSGFHSVRMVVGDRLRLATSLVGTRKQLVRWAVQQRILFRPPEFVNQQINSLREPDQVVSGLRVSGQDYRMRTIVDAVAERRLDGPMVYQERRDLYPIGFVDDALANVGCDYLDAFGRKLLVHIAPDVDIERKRFLQMLQHRSGAIRPPHLQWLIPVLRGPGKQIEFRQGDDVI